ncbi:MAG TPA: hypothetical protein VNE63_00515 [Candidatus Acidoferrales bacterium]|nr:hypothetical protein [Candidatus Acidoferrales bacterium]
MLKKIALVACVYSLAMVSTLSATEATVDESLRLDVLQAAFPKTTISLAVGRSIDDSWNPKSDSKEFLFPDALATEKVYRVVGPVSGPTEQCAASDVTSDNSSSKIREVRFQVFPWPGAADRSALLAVFQYEFRGANPPLSCPSIARISRVTRTDGKWREAASVTLGTTHHTAIQRVELTDLAGDHAQELLIESDWGGAGVSGTNLIIFSLTHARFDQWLNVPSRVYHSAGGDSFVQMLELPRTRQEHAKRFCFQKITFAKEGLWLSQPLKTQSCYPRFTGQSAREQLITPDR